MPTQPLGEDGQVWFLTGSQARYGEETLRQVAEHSQRIVETLAARRVETWTRAALGWRAAVGLEALEDFARIAATELLLIDAATDRRRFGKELGWNQAYYRLARGL